MALLGRTTTYEYDPSVFVVAYVITLISVVISFQKGKPGFGIIGIFFGIFAWVGAIRIAKPDSSWARKNYPPGGHHRGPFESGRPSWSSPLSSSPWRWDALGVTAVTSALMAMAISAIESEVDAQVK